MLDIQKIKIFPRVWDWRRIAEFYVAAYQAGVGSILWMHPESFQHSSYAGLRTMMPSSSCWALALMTVAAGHVMAIWMNGRQPWISSTCRVIAIAIHLVILALMARGFVMVEDYWRMTTTVFIALPVLACLTIAAEDMQRAGAK